MILCLHSLWLLEAQASCANVLDWLRWPCLVWRMLSYGCCCCVLHWCCALCWSPCGVWGCACLLLACLFACLLLVCFWFASDLLLICLFASRVPLVCFSVSYRLLSCASSLLPVCFLFASCVRPCCFVVTSFLVRVWCLRGFGWECFLAAFLVLSRGPGIADTRAGESKNSARRNYGSADLAGDLWKHVQNWLKNGLRKLQKVALMRTSWRILSTTLSRGVLLGRPKRDPKRGPIFAGDHDAKLWTCKSWEREARQGRRVGPKTPEHESRFSWQVWTTQKANLEDMLMFVELLWMRQDLCGLSSSYKSMPKLVMFDLVTWSCRDLLRVVLLGSVGRSPLRMVWNIVLGPV